MSRENVRTGVNDGHLLLLQHDLCVELRRSRHADDGRAEVTDSLLSHRRQRRLLLASLLLRATVKIERHAIDAAVQRDHCCQRHPEIPDLHPSNTRCPIITLNTTRLPSLHVPGMTFTCTSPRLFYISARRPDWQAEARCSQSVLSFVRLLSNL